MKLEQITLPVNNKLVADYWSEEATIHTFFDYQYNEQSFKARAEYLRAKDYQTKRFAQVVRGFMTKYGVHELAEKHLTELENGALVVVAGQQAGLLTGPLYSVHKAISVILLAKEQREKLQIPVVPMFWIAGEDHDLEEINHTYIIVDAVPKKRGYSERSKRKTMASTTELNKEMLQKFVQTVFKDFGETAYTEQLVANVTMHAEKSATFTDFFTTLMNDLFANYGLLMIDAANMNFRQYEQPFFEALVRRNEDIAKVVVAQEQALEAAGYGKPIEATESNANLFYVKEGERFLLERKEGYFSNALAHVKLTKEELLQHAIESPQSFSNNVVTRPLMQEMTMPVLAFVGGPGELAYWATLKEAFHTLDLQMPIFAPRLNITLVTRQTESLMQQHDLSFKEVLAGEAKVRKQAFIASIQDQVANDQLAQMEEMLQTQYDTLSEHLIGEQLQVEKLVAKNKAYHLQQFDFLRNKIAQLVAVKHDVAIRQFDTLQAELAPLDNYQERLYNPYQYMNHYGPTFIDDLLSMPMTISTKHQVVTL